MSLKKVEQVKSDRGFKIWDLIIYGVIIALVAILLIVVFTTRNNDPLTGVRIYASGEEVFEYSFDGEPTYAAWVKVESGDKLITVTLEREGDVNVVVIDKSAKTVKMTHANCKGRDCTYMSMSTNSDFIYCSAHQIKVEPYITDYDKPIIF